MNQPPAPTSGATFSRLSDVALENDLYWLDANYGGLSAGEQKLISAIDKLWCHIQNQDAAIKALKAKLEAGHE